MHRLRQLGRSSGGGGLYNGNGAGTGTLEDTIIAGNNAGNIGRGGASDIAGSGAGDVTGTYDLIGIGGPGGITDGSGGDIVLTSLANLGWPRWGTTAGRPGPWP